MAWIPTSPESKTVAGPPVSKAMNRFKVLEIMIDAQSNGVCLTLGEGYDSGGTFVEVARRQVNVDPGTDELVAVMTALCDPTKDLYTQIRDSSYTLLADLGILPAGTPE
jgi:hypothetical protein